MGEDEKTPVPQVIMDPKDYEALMQRLDELETKVENTNAEVYQTAGRKVGRDTGILYGLTIGLILYNIFPLIIKLIDYLSMLK
ncbi:tetrahydromethanopterin S-methyltransferase subunit MtrG [Methanothermococcus okinawensis]|jgi:tetrahydromethanopterin S-methyltransferase subunit G|uniref:Tetrahydromethanopterin S-methyltransferase subunit G n=1 Tax=Methanothermococcus okinawensis (strain DSM 14208 / JCM 11175 / IH1) TaxID=647113 RepID=F8ALH2_METOI|nr:tetrahydromethanopterin S-methyltransferase subunit G [Methanothermococcus okinawensis]AEH06919.1 Tetrahydromethanopterin S-methyltransferase subunit G [Methanothermococcus okinawensis IH1]